jgi:branched-chain amino acid transport system substrate-binding protein
LGVGALAAFPFAPGVRAQEPILLGLQADLTGVLLDYGYWHEKVIRAAVNEINAEGGIAGRPVELLVEDTATSSEIGRDKLIKLVQNGASIVIGSQSSSVSLASLPLAEELKALYFPLGEATEITGEAGNRYVFRLNHSVLSHAQVGHRWAIENLGKRWTIVVAGYSFGESHAQAWPPLLEQVGGEVLDVISVPLETTDFLPFLSQVDPHTEVLFHVFPGSNAVQFLTAAGDLGLLETMNFFGVIGTVDGIRVQGNRALEGSWFISNHPRRLDQVPEDRREFDVAFRGIVGVTPEGWEEGTGRATTGSHYWYGWEILHLLKRAIEETGWRSQDDHPDLVRFLEGVAIEKGFSFPQGDKFIRAQDHQAFHDHYIERLLDEKLVVVERFDKSLAVYEPLADYTTEEL